jgi:hypothetical protein
LWSRAPLDTGNVQTPQGTDSKPGSIMNKFSLKGSNGSHRSARRNPAPRVAGTLLTEPGRADPLKHLSISHTALRDECKPIHMQHKPDHISPSINTYAEDAPYHLSTASCPSLLLSEGNLHGAAPNGSFRPGGASRGAGVALASPLDP